MNFCVHDSSRRPFVGACLRAPALPGVGGLVGFGRPRRKAEGERSHRGLPDEVGSHTAGQAARARYPERPQS